MSKYVIKKNILELVEKEIVFDQPIRTVLEKDKIFIVLLLKNELTEIRKHYQSRNIFGISPDGEILWQVEAPTQDPVDLYTGLFEEDGHVIGYAWSGGDCYLDPKTGKVLKKILVR